MGRDTPEGAPRVEHSREFTSFCSVRLLTTQPPRFFSTVPAMLRNTTQKSNYAA